MAFHTRNGIRNPRYNRHLQYSSHSEIIMYCRILIVVELRLLINIFVFTAAVTMLFFFLALIRLSAQFFGVGYEPFAFFAVDCFQLCTKCLSDQFLVTVKQMNARNYVLFTKSKKKKNGQFPLCHANHIRVICARALLFFSLNMDETIRIDCPEKLDQLLNWNTTW